jgi:ATP-dependent DNA ligase
MLQFHAASPMASAFRSLKFQAGVAVAVVPRSPFEPCIPTRGTKVPEGAEWIHEIKHDGYRLIVQRDGKMVRLFTRNGHDWSGRFPLITTAALRNRNSSFVIDGEAVLLGVDDRSDFNGLHSRKHDAEAQFYAFDILVSDGEDLRRLPLSMRKTNLARLLARPDRRDLPVRFRARRDRSRSIPPCLPAGTGGYGLQAPRALVASVTKVSNMRADKTWFYRAFFEELNRQ